MADGYILLLGAAMQFRESAGPAVRRQLPGAVLMDVAASVQQMPYPGLDYVLVGNPFDSSSVLQAVERWAEQTGMGPKAAVPFSERTVDAADAVAAKYGLTRQPNVQRLRDKLLMKAAWQRAGLRVARFAPCDDYPSLRKASEAIGTFPQVIKPRLLGGSLGVRCAATFEDLLAAFDDCQRTVSLISEPYGGFLLEEFLVGQEVSVEVIHSNGCRAILGVVDKIVTAPPYFAEVGQSVPSRFSSVSSILDLALRACEILDMRHGWAHVELFICDGIPMLSEVGARPPGDLIPDLIEEAYGVNGYGLHAASYLGAIGLPELRAANHIEAVAFLKAPPGRIEAIRPPTSYPIGVSKVVIVARPGDVSGPADSNNKREGFAMFAWPDMNVPLGEHVRVAAELSREMFVVSSLP